MYDNKKESSGGSGPVSRGCLPEVLRGEGSVQVRVHVPGALLHGPRVGDEGFGVHPLPLDLGAVLHPQVHERHAGHLVAVRAAEYRHPPGLVEARAVVAGGHGAEEEGAG